jgi:hypothetical protein
MLSTPRRFHESVTRRLEGFGAEVIVPWRQCSMPTSVVRPDHQLYISTEGGHQCQ